MHGSFKSDVAVDGSRAAPLAGEPKAARLTFVPFDAAHLHALALQPDQAYLQELVETPGFASTMRNAGFAWTGLVGAENGETRVAGCAGILPQWQGRAHCWAMFGEVPRDGWVAITRLVRRVLAEAHAQGIWRIDTTVRAHFIAGHRLARACGFTPDGYHVGWDPTGTDHVAYVHLDRIALEGFRAKQQGLI